MSPLIRAFAAPRAMVLTAPSRSFSVYAMRLKESDLGKFVLCCVVLCCVLCILRPGIFSGVNAIVQCNIGKQQNRENQLADRIYFGGTIGNPDTAAQYEIHKQDLLRKVKEGRGHWKPELASDSEEAVCFLIYLFLSLILIPCPSFISLYPWRENEENRFCVGIYIHTIHTHSL